MDAFVSRKRKRSKPEPAADAARILETTQDAQHEEEPTEFKLALLASLHTNLDEATLLETLLAADGSVEQASDYLNQPRITSPRKRATLATVGYQSSLSAYRIAPPDGHPAKKTAVKKGKTLCLYSPEDIEAHTPCSVIHNFFPAKQADALLLQLLEDTPTYKKFEFKLFNRVVSSSNTFAFYVNSLKEVEEQKTEYIYDGRKIEVG